LARSEDNETVAPLVDVVVPLDVDGVVMQRRFRAAVTAVVAAAGLLAVCGPAAAGQTGPAPRSPAAVPVPAGFRAQSVSWPSAAEGWVLGAVPCAGGACTAVAHTTDGGASWSLTGAPAAPLAPSGEHGVTSIRFAADGLHGWAYGPDLYATSDGGTSWQPVRLPGRQALALAAGTGAVYLATSPCDVGKLCTASPAVYRAPLPAATGWLQVPVRLPGVPTQVVLAARGPVVYVLGTQVPPTPDAFSVGTNGGTRWAPRPSPCAKDQDQALVDVAPVDATAVALLCVGNPGRSRADKHVFRSADTGMSTVDAGVTDTLGIQSRLAATAGTLLVSSVSAGDWLYRSAGGQKWTVALDLADGGVGWNDPVFSTDQDAWVVYGPAAAAPDLPGQLLHSADAGRTWSTVTFAG
jgi:photosystem II stability/assembly factor-like uncharacterized protein